MITSMSPIEVRSPVLVIDDDPAIHELVEVILRPLNVDVISVMDGDHAIEEVSKNLPDLIMLDYEMPGANGLEVLKRLRESGVTDSTPVVFVTANDSHKILTACFQAGATDYIRKPFCAPELCARVSSVLDRKRMVGQLEQLAHLDPLTRLFNRTSIRERLQHAIDRAPAQSSSVLFLDFDRFKLINDSLGHDIGDQLLQQIAQRLSSALRRTDRIGHLADRTTAARLGGDEFVVLLEDLRDPQDALKVADRLLNSLEDPYYLAGHNVCCTASIGVVNCIEPNSTPDEVLRDADTAMYEAKSAGKGRYVLFDQGMHENAQERLVIENDLRNAIANDELLVEYQPIVSLETGRTEGFEALVRWQHPDRGLVPPGVFLPTAEESGLIVPIGTWVLDRACRDFSIWQRTLGDMAPSKIHVNVSRKQLLRDLIEKVKTVLEKYSIPPKCLHLEVTENEIMQNPEVAKATLEELRRLGVKIDMDDFGTGHSSLACLQELPIDVLKIDRSFIANMERSRSFAALVHAVATLGLNLGLSVVAEGIESADQLAMLQFMECQSGQGYFFAKPMRSEKVPVYLCERANRSLDPFASEDHFTFMGVPTLQN